MHFAAALAAGFAALHTASAFLIPPKASLPDLHDTEEKVNAQLARLFGLESKWQIELDCPSCRWAGVDYEHTPDALSQRPEISLIVEIDSDKQSGLLINDIPTLASGFESPQPVSLSARQKRVDTGEETIPIPIDFVMERLEPIISEDPAKMIIPVKFTIVGFGGQPVKVDTLSIDILQTPEIMKVMRVDRVPFAETPGAQSCEGESAWSMCRVRAIITHRVIETMRMMRVKAHQAKGWVKHCGGHRHHGHRHRAHRWAKMLHSTLRFFIIPALLGVIGGLLASAVGMLVGQFIVLLWTQFGRRGHRGPLRTEIVEIIVTEDEKDGLLDAQCDDEEGLPEYEHAPRYEDVEAQVNLEGDKE